MALQHDVTNEEQIDRAIDELKSMIVQRFPTVTFEVGPGYDPDGTYLDAVLDTADLDIFSDELNELVWQRVMDMWGDDLAVFVCAALPPHRVAEWNRRVLEEAESATP